MKAITAIMAILVMLAGCATTDNGNQAGEKLLVQGSILQLIEQSDDVTAEKVVATVERIRERIVGNEEVRYVDLRERLLEEINFASMDPFDQLIVMNILDQLALDVEVGMETDILREEDRVRIDQLLGWVEQAAIMAM